MSDYASLDTYPAVNRDEIFVTWSTSWTVERYIAWYLESRRHPLDDEWQAAVREALKSFPGRGALRKTDVDFFLDTNAPSWAPVWVTNRIT